VTDATVDITIRQEDPCRDDARALIAAADALMASLYPAESNHLVDAESLGADDAMFLVARRAGQALGSIACRLLEPGHAEMKRLFVAPAARSLGLGRRLIAALEDAAGKRGILRLSLETGVRQPEAIALYRTCGYIDVPPFGAYRPDPLSVFMSKRLTSGVGTTRNR
jgi:putative acetyltransferase